MEKLCDRFCAVMVTIPQAAALADVCKKLNFLSQSGNYCIRGSGGYEWLYMSSLRGKAAISVRLEEERPWLRDLMCHFWGLEIP